MLKFNPLCCNFAGFGKFFPPMCLIFSTIDKNVMFSTVLDEGLLSWYLAR